MTKTERNRIVSLIEAETDFDTSTIRFHKDGTISGIKDADKTFNAPETIRLNIGHVSEFEGGRNPFRA